MIATSIVGDGPHTIAFIHGLFGRGKNFSTIAKSLSNKYRSVLIDAPNHGESSWTMSVDLRGWANQIVEVLDELGVLGDNLTVLGHSMGGKIAMWVGLDHPDKIGSLIIEDMSAVSYSINRDFLPYIHAMRSIKLDQITSRLQADEQLKQVESRPSVRQFLLQNLRTRPAADGKIEWYWQPNLNLLEREIHQIGRWVNPPGMHFEKPVLWMGGQNSNFVSAKYEPAMRSLFPSLFKLIIKDSGHWIHSDQPKIFTESIHSFIERISV